MDVATSEDLMRKRVTAALAANGELGAAEIDPDVPMSGLPGMDSVQLLRAVTDLEDACGFSIPDQILFEAGTVRELARLLTEMTGERP